MDYKLVKSRHYRVSLKKLNNSLINRINKKVRVLKEHPSFGKPLKYSDFWELRVGKYRIFYKIKHAEKTIMVYSAIHKKYIDKKYDKFLRFFKGFTLLYIFLV